MLIKKDISLSFFRYIIFLVPEIPPLISCLSPRRTPLLRTLLRGRWVRIFIVILLISFIFKGQKVGCTLLGEK